MTLAIAVGVRDGIIAAADSRTSYTDEANQLRIGTDYTHKLYRINDVAIATAGWNIFSGRTVASHMADLAPATPGTDSESVAVAVRDYFLKAYADHKTANPNVTPAPDTIAVEFLISDFQGGKPEVRRLVIHEPSKENPDGWFIGVSIPRGDYGMSWIGMTDVVQRLFNGYCVPLPDGDLKNYLSNSVQPIAYALMALQDALNLATFCVEATIRMQRFSTSRSATMPENANVGGEIDYAKITRDGFDWIKKKELEVSPQLSEDSTAV